MLSKCPLHVVHCFHYFWTYFSSIVHKYAATGKASLGLCTDHNFFYSSLTFYHYFSRRKTERCTRIHTVRRHLGESLQKEHITMYGTITRKLKLELRRDVVWHFVITDAEGPVIEIEFLSHYNLLVDPSARRRNTFISKGPNRKRSHRVHSHCHGRYSVSCHNITDYCRNI